MNVKRDFFILKFLADEKPSVKLINSLPNKVIKTIAEIAYNLLHGNANLTDTEKAYITRKRKLLQKVATQKATLKARRQLLSRIDLQILIPPALRNFADGNADETSS